LSNLIALNLPVTKIGAYLVAVIEIVGDSGVHIREIQTRVLLRYFFGSGAIKKCEDYGIEGNPRTAYTDNVVRISGEWRRLS